MEDEIADIEPRTPGAWDSEGYGGNTDEFAHVSNTAPSECYKAGCHKQADHRVHYTDPPEERDYCLSHAISEYRRTSTAYRLEWIQKLDSDDETDS
jgi:hypothetical protein